jgi:hypothetical protein
MSSIAWVGMSDAGADPGRRSGAATARQRREAPSRQRARQSLCRSESPPARACTQTRASNVSGTSGRLRWRAWRACCAEPTARTFSHNRGLGCSSAGGRLSFRGSRWAGGARDAAPHAPPDLALQSLAPARSKKTVGVKRDGSSRVEERFNLSAEQLVKASVSISTNAAAGCAAHRIAGAAAVFRPCDRAGGTRTRQPLAPGSSRTGKAECLRSNMRW